ncbi:MAG: zinc-finger domain-containing protein [Rhodobiaceae bacterium]|nr:zinc-finger domain-containing protein [Rhodobiaceae bacterium]MCC0055936.1 zinc-finger domain-containing protein [Rhodobiaceae bacterium]
MADKGIPHFHNSGGFPAISIGAREFQCIGALPPYDHPHVYLDMGDDKEIVCPYCSTLFRHDEQLAAGKAEPAECLYQGR